MDLVEETAAYLDGAGRVEAKALDRSVSAHLRNRKHAVTTRLMHWRHGCCCTVRSRKAR